MTDAQLVALLANDLGYFRLGPEGDKYATLEEAARLVFAAGCVWRGMMEEREQRIWEADCKAERDDAGPF